MFKRAILGFVFVAAVLAGTVGFTASADAYHGHCGGGWYGAHYPHYHGYHHRPRFRAHYHGYGGWGHHHHGHYYHGPRSGVSFYFGF
jgi:hypothetical protein